MCVCGARRVVSCGERASGRKRRTRRTGEGGGGGGGRRGEPDEEEWEKEKKADGRGEKTRKQDVCIITF